MKQTNRPPEIALAQTAPLTPAQQAFRSAARHRLDLALPLEVWFDHHYAVVPTQRANPVARNGAERWYDFMQVVKRGVDPRTRRHITMVSGGGTGVAKRRR